MISKHFLVKKKCSILWTQICYGYCSKCSSFPHLSVSLPHLSVYTLPLPLSAVSNVSVGTAPDPSSSTAHSARAAAECRARIASCSPGACVGRRRCIGTSAGINRREIDSGQSTLGHCTEGGSHDLRGGRGGRVGAGHGARERVAPRMVCRGAHHAASQHASVKHHLASRAGAPRCMFDGGETTGSSSGGGCRSNARVRQGRRSATPSGD